MAVQTSTIYAIQPVSAGDLITAQFVNKLVAAVLDLDARVRGLEAKAQSAGTGAAAGLTITSAVLTMIGPTTAINVVGTGLEPAGLNSFKINTIPFTPLGSVLGDDGEIVIAIPPNANAQILTAIQNAGFTAFTLTLGSTKGQSASAQVGGRTFVFNQAEMVDFGSVAFANQPAATAGTGAATNVGANVGPNFANIAGRFAFTGFAGGEEPPP
ncbi:MAG TPA: hypothetical protein VGW40_08950 [Allosphingosinicella sp.]|nr:hypothetical protein [Allosphingosinicella sp.]